MGVSGTESYRNGSIVAPCGTRLSLYCSTYSPLSTVLFRRRVNQIKAKSATRSAMPPTTPPAIAPTGGLDFVIVPPPLPLP